MNKFLNLSQTRLDWDNDNYGESSCSVEKVKLAIISRLIRKMFVTLSLSKTQMNILNRFIKGVLVFINRDNLEFARKIHASYDSCLRESFNQARLTDSVIRKCFDTCDYFSVALDTSLFVQDQVFVCTVRFTFKTHMEQFPLFFSVCDASTGQELAAFVFGRLQRNDVPFAKLVSVATDGAYNMLGRFNGMVSHLKRLVQQALGVVTPTFDHVWCLAHRLNLVIRDFQDVPDIKHVLLFADLFRSKRKAVVYKKWLRSADRDRRFKKIPKPSETRWSFYKVVLESLLSQVDKVDEFLKQDRDFLSFRRKLFPLSNQSHQYACKNSFQVNSSCVISSLLTLSSKRFGI